MANTISSLSSSRRRGSRSDALKKSILQQAVEGKLTGADTSKWVETTLGDLFRVIPPKSKVKTKEMLAYGKYPVVDQGQSIIAGYTNVGVPNIIEEPVIIFGDHTRAVKYVDFDFVAGADGTKILNAKPNVDTDFLFKAIQNSIPPSRGYGRHFAQLRDTEFHLPPLATQTRIVAKIDQLFTKLDRLETK